MGDRSNSYNSARTLAFVGGWLSSEFFGNSPERAICAGATDAGGDARDFYFGGTQHLTPAARAQKKIGLENSHDYFAVDTAARNLGYFWGITGNRCAN